MSRVIGVNGIRTDGAGSTDRLLSRMGGQIKTIDFNYGRVNLLTARSRSRQRDAGARLYDLARPHDHVVAHSYGALIVLRAMEAGAQFGAVFLFSPAMDSRQYFPPQGARQIYVISHPADRAIGLGALLWRHDFGLMGRNGYQGPPDKRVTDFPTRDDAPGQGLLNHSNYFSEANVNGWAQYVARQIRILDGG